MHLSALLAGLSKSVVVGLDVVERATRQVLNRQTVLVLSSTTIAQPLQLVLARHSIGWQGAPLAIRAFLDFRILTHLLLVVDLHHVDAGKILLHLLAILDALAVNDIVDMLDFVWAHLRQALLRSSTHSQDGLVDRRKLVVFVRSS